ncbi:13597_t:CDS:2, partial [Racocetra persica]
NLIECNTTRTGYFVNSTFTSIGDSGIDLFEFSAVLAKQAENNVIEKIKATHLKLENDELQKNSFELNDLVIENFEIDSDKSTVYLFGIKINGKCKIGKMRIER